MQYKALQNALDVVQEFAEKVGLTASAEKAKYMTAANKAGRKKLAVPAAVAQWLWRCASVPNVAGSIPGRGGRFLMQAKSENARVFEISAHVKDPQVVKINSEPCTTARPIVWVASAR